MQLDLQLMKDDEQLNVLKKDSIEIVLVQLHFFPSDGL